MCKQTNNRKVFDLKNFGIPRCPQFGHYKYNNVKPGLQDHIHANTIEICFFLKGIQRYKIGSQLLELTGNDILIIAPNTLHSTGIHPEDKGELYWLQVSLQENIGALCHLPNQHSELLLQELAKNAHQIFKGSFVLKSVLIKLENELQKPKSIMTELRINQLILQLLLETVAVSKNQKHAPASDRLKLIDRFIAEQMERSIFVDELASLVDLSVPYFKEWFKKKQGLPPKEYINRAKIDQAKMDLLIKSSITNVAFDLGYSSSQYFATSFKKYTGVTPKSYIVLAKKSSNT